MKGFDISKITDGLVFVGQVVGKILEWVGVLMGFLVKVLAKTIVYLLTPLKVLYTILGFLIKVIWTLISGPIKGLYNIFMGLITFDMKRIWEGIKQYLGFEAFKKIGELFYKTFIEPFTNIGNVFYETFIDPIKRLADYMLSFIPGRTTQAETDVRKTIEGYDQMKEAGLLTKEAAAAAAAQTKKEAESLQEEFNQRNWFMKGTSRLFGAIPLIGRDTQASALQKAEAKNAEAIRDYNKFQVGTKDITKEHNRKSPTQ